MAESGSISFVPVVLVGGILLVALLAAGLTYFLFRSSYRLRLQAMLSPAAKAAYARRDDEFGQVARAIQQLEEEQELCAAEAERLRQNLEGLLSISEASLRSVSLENVYQHVCDVILDVTGFSSASIHLTEPGEQFVYLVASKGVQPILEEIRTERFDYDYMRIVKETLEPDCSSDMQIDGRRYPQNMIDQGWRAWFKAPMVVGDKLIGILTISAREVHVWTNEEQRWLVAIGRQLAVLIDHLRISEKVRNFAVLQERERLSGELHDNLSQMIGTVRILSERVAENCEKGDFIKVRNDADTIETIARDMYTGIREEMYGLRALREPDQDLISTLREYLARYQRQWSVETAFEVKSVSEPYLISAFVSIQLLRIIQEALVNVRRHAQATRVDICLEALNDRLRVQVKDNGIGFNPQAVFENRLGLRIMRERAASLGGSLRIVSGPESGTLVQVELPKDGEQVKHPEEALNG